MLVRNNILTFITLGKISRRQADTFRVLFVCFCFVLGFFLQKIGFDILCKLSSKETVCVKCQSLFSGRKKKNISKCLLKFFYQHARVKNTVELQWLEHLWDHGKVFESWVVRANEG